MGLFSLTVPTHLPSDLELSTLLLSVLYRVLVLTGVYLCALSVYRLYFHPLAKYPGSVLSTITVWHTVYHAWKGDRFVQLYHLHQKYGPVVRVAPNTLSFNTASALKTIYGHSRQAQALQKSQFYNAFPATRGVHNTHNSINKIDHGFKRRVLSAGFSEAALKSMEIYVIENVNTMINNLKAKGDEGVDMGSTFSYLTFDIMGELCFGKPFGLLKETTLRYITELVGATAHLHYIAGHNMTIRRSGIERILVPKIHSDRWRFLALARQLANERMQMEVETKKDFFYYLLHAKDSETGRGFTTPELWGESALLIIAGSDTTAAALSSMLYYLCANPDTLKKLQKEIREAFQNEDEIVTGKTLADCTYLKACIDEALRMSPSVPGLLPREIIAEEGCVIDGEHIPCGTIVGVPTYAIHHNEEYFPSPFSYQPERWLEGSTEQHEKIQSAFTPFSLGSRGCIGKSLAYIELRVAMARLVWNFEFEQVPTKDMAENWMSGYGVTKTDYKLKDGFTTRKAGPVVKFVRRADVS